MLRALREVAALLQADRCWLYQRRYHFALCDGWTIAISPDSAGRIRIDACRWTRSRTTLWALESDTDRLAGVVCELVQDIDAVSVAEA